MPFAPWVRARLQHANNWRDELAQIRQGLTTERRGPATAERLFDVACATEYCDPDRGRALGLYLDAWRDGHADARAQARRLATVLGAHMALAEIAKADGDLLAEGTAYLDAGFRDLAIAPFEKLAKNRATDGSLTALHAVARGAKLDFEREITDSLVRARNATGAAAGAAFAHAVRIARAGQLEARVPSILVAAVHACPDDAAVLTVVEARLFEIRNVDELLAHYSARLERAPSQAEYAERARAAGVQLIEQNVQPGLGLRLLRMGLEHAYRALLPDITSHIAAWELLWTHAQVQHSAIDLLPLLGQALLSPLPEDDALYLARLALEISWRHAHDIAGAKPYAAIVIAFVPDHPLAAAFVTEAAPEMLDATPPPAPVPVTQPAPPPMSSRIPIVDQGQVKRVNPVSKKSHGVTTRMALLTPRAPPPPLPAPAAPPPPSPEFRPRAERKVLPVDVVVELANGTFFSTVLRDVSTSGAFIVTKRELEVGSNVALEMRIPTLEMLAQSSHRVIARIARRTDIGYGLAFVDAAGELISAIRTTTRTKS